MISLRNGVRISSVSCLLFMSLPAMEQRKIMVKQYGNIIQLNATETDEPKLSLGICAQCQGKPTLQCKQCQGVEYCSVKCRDKYAAQHHKDCAKIREVEKGNLERIESFFRANIYAVKKNKDKKYLDNALMWHRRLLVRLRQDSACSTDPSTYSAVDAVQLDHGAYFRELINNNFVTTEEAIRIERPDEENLLAAVAWAEKLTNNNTLISPAGILNYGMFHYLPKETQKKPAELLFKQETWKELRLQVIADYKKKFNK